MIERIREAWRALLGRRAITEVRNVTIDEIPPYMRLAIIECLEKMAFKMQSDMDEFDAACEISPQCYHCTCWHRGGDSCCCCDAEVPEEREAIRRDE